MKFLVVVQILVHLFLSTEACAEIRLTAEDNSVIIGRSSEMQMDMMSNVVVQPKGHFHTAVVPEKCAQYSPMTWQNKYNIAYLDGLNLPFGADGQNDAGLSVGALSFPGFTKYQE